MTVFVSYSSRDDEVVNSLSQDLEAAEEQVWMDQHLAGGDAWWRAILEQIRSCEVFIFALSQNSIESKPCQAELRYAEALGLPILPVQVGPVDSMQLNPLATVQAIDYRHANTGIAMRLSAALRRERARRQPLPSPLPDEPPVPFEYLIRLYTTIAGPDLLTPRDQAALVAQLEVGLREDGQHESARRDIVTLLRKLREREDVTYRTRTDVDAILASIEVESEKPPRLDTDQTDLGGEPPALPIDQPVSLRQSNPPMPSPAASPSGGVDTQDRPIWKRPSVVIPSAIAALVAITVGLITLVAASGGQSRLGPAPEATRSSASSVDTTIVTVASPTPTEAAGPNKTIQDYLKENQITETQVKRGDSGAPTIDLPTPPDWSDAGAKTPEWAYGAILYDKAEVPDDPPSIIAIVSKLTGNVDPAKILDYAPGELKNLPGWEALGDGSKSTLGGFDAFQMGGNYTRDGKKRIIAQKTVVIPSQDGVYVLQMNADALDGQEGPLMDATNVIDEKTTITT